MSDKFWSKVDIRGPDECWPWTAATNGKYGWFWVDGRCCPAHRYAFAQENPNDFIDDPKMHVHHKCENKLCCNPTHLEQLHISHHLSAKHGGTPHTEESKQKISKANKGKPGWNKGRKFPIVTCPHCGKSGGIPGMARWHFDNCRFNL